jgi:hypothetical protein
MEFFIHSGVGIQPFVDRFDSATRALETVRVYLEEKYPNVRIFNEDGETLTVATLLRPAAREVWATKRLCS